MSFKGPKPDYDSMVSVVSFHLMRHLMYKLECMGCCSFKEAQSKLPLGSVCSEPRVPGDCCLLSRKHSAFVNSNQSSLVLSFPCCLAELVCVGGAVGGEAFKEIP